MKCAKLHLQERFKPKTKPEACYSAVKPLRYCQKRMVNPEHEEDPRWADVYGRFHCLEENYNINDVIDSGRGNPEEDLFLSVQTLKFQGNAEQPKRYRSSFKYKSPNVGGKHRMFVKQVITDEDEHSDDDRSSELTSYYFDDYVKYLFNNEKSRPASGKSSVFLQSLSNKIESKVIQIDHQTDYGNKKIRPGNNETKSLVKKCVKNEVKHENISSDVDVKDTKITFQKSGRRRSLTISRTQSPEIMQVIRVDVVCNHNRASTMSDYDDNLKLDCNKSSANVDLESVDMKKSHFADKYLLTNTIKTLDENLAGGEKVTLLCKTFKLSERSKLPAHKAKTVSEAKSINTCSKKSAPRYKGLQLLQDQVAKMLFSFNNR